MRLRGTNRNFRRVSPRVPFNPRKLFRNSEQGVWHDPSDLSTLFQDSAGTTPVTAVEQPVGLMLDKSRGLVLGPELYSGGDITGVPIGGATFNNYSLGITSQVGKAYRFSINVSGYSGTNTYSVGGVFGTDWVTATVARTGDGIWTFTLIALRALALSLFTRSTNTANFSNISVRELPGNHAFQPTAIDRPILRQDAGGRYYLAANGTNTWMQTNSIDFSGTDKVTVFAGVRKLSDAATGVFLELSPVINTNPGGFALRAPHTAGANYAFISNGTILDGAVSGNSYPAPISSVLTVVGDISGDRTRLRINGAEIAVGVGDQGTGNYGNYPLYLFRRGGTSLPFNGQFHGLLIRGALTSAPDTLKMEKWLSFKTGVQL